MHIGDGGAGLAPAGGDDLAHGGMPQQEPEQLATGVAGSAYHCNAKSATHARLPTAVCDATHAPYPLRATSTSPAASRRALWAGTPRVARM